MITPNEGLNLYIGKSCNIFKLYAFQHVLIIYMSLIIIYYSNKKYVHPIKKLQEIFKLYRFIFCYWPILSSN